MSVRQAKIRITPINYINFQIVCKQKHELINHIISRSEANLCISVTCRYVGLQYFFYVYWFLLNKDVGKTRITRY